jgi:hypothetical protein
VLVVDYNLRHDLLLSSSYEGRILASRR